MPSFQPIPINFDYTPQGLDELLVPLNLYKQEYDKRVADIDTRRQGLAAFAPYMNEQSPEASARYDELNRRIEENMQYIGKPGYLLHERPIIALKGDYARTIADFTNATKNMEAQKAHAVQERSKHPNLVYNFRDKDGGFVAEPSLDNYLDNGNLDFVSVDADDMLNKASALAKGISSRLAHAANGAYISKRQDPLEGSIVEWKTKETGAPVILALDWLLHPERHAEEINRFKKQHPGREYQQLFESSVADDIKNLKGHSAYSLLDEVNQRRVDDAISFGFDAGLGPYSIDKTENWTQPKDSGGSGGGGEVTPWEPRAVKTKPQVYVTDTQDTDEEEEYRNIMRYFGVDDSNFWQTYDLDLQKRLSLFNGNRQFDDGSWFSSPHDWREADKLVNGTSDFGISDWFSPFGDDGRLLTRAQFNEAYGDKFKEINSLEYVQRMRNNADLGAKHEQLFNNMRYDDFAKYAKPVPPSLPNDPNLNTGVTSTPVLPSIAEVHHNLGSAMMAAFEVPKKQREDILSDPTGAKLDKWIEENNITEGKFKGKLLDLADMYANTQRDLMQFRFANDNEGILKDVLEKSVNGDGKLDLKEVVRYEFSKKDDQRKLVTKTKDATLSDFEDLGDAKDYIYKIPADPSEGLILKNMTTGKEYLVPSKKLGSLYDNEQVNLNVSKIEEAQKYKDEIVNQMKSVYIQIGNIEANAALASENKAVLIEPLYEKIRALQEDYNLMTENQTMYTSGIVKTVQDKLSSSYKPKSY